MSSMQVTLKSIPLAHISLWGFTLCCGHLPSNVLRNRKPRSQNQIPFLFQPLKPLPHLAEDNVVHPDVDFGNWSHLTPPSPSTHFQLGPVRPVLRAFNLAQFHSRPVFSSLQASTFYMPVSLGAQPSLSSPRYPHLSQLGGDISFSRVSFLPPQVRLRNPFYVPACCQLLL